MIVLQHVAEDYPSCMICSFQCPLSPLLPDLNCPPPPHFTVLCWMSSGLTLSLGIVRQQISESRKAHWLFPWSVTATHTSLFGMCCVMSCHFSQIACCLSRCYLTTSDEVKFSCQSVRLPYEDQGGKVVLSFASDSKKSCAGLAYSSVTVHLEVQYRCSLWQFSKQRPYSPPGRVQKWRQLKLFLRYWSLVKLLIFLLRPNHS